MRPGKILVVDENLLMLSQQEPEIWQAVSLPEALDELVAVLPRDAGARP